MTMGKKNETISLERDNIMLIGNGNNIIIPFDPREGKSWMEPWEEDIDARKKY